VDALERGGESSTADAIYTIGHSTRSVDDFVAILKSHGIVQLADIRTIPRSRRHPQFEREALRRSLADAGIDYRHMAALGGLRKPRKDSANSAWRNEGFRGYADYMETAAFAAALDDLLAWARGDASDGRARRTAIMCAEAVWWRCHRQLVADALVARGVEVRHVVSATTPASPHHLSDFARVEAGRVVYRRLI
jgi:uncharacterized protein (DUF488 family)